MKWITFDKDGKCSECGEAFFLNFNETNSFVYDIHRIAHYMQELTLPHD